MKAPILSLDERILDRHRLRDRDTNCFIVDPALDCLAVAMKSARGAAEQIEAAARMIPEDASHSPEANALRLKRVAMQLAERATRSLDEARQRATSELDAIERAMVLKPPAEAGEIRTALRGMTREDRTKALVDDAVAAAALSAVPMLSGLSEPEVNALRGRIQRAKFPDKVDRKIRISRALEDLERGGNALVTFANGVAEAGGKVEAAAERAKAAESAAQREVAS